MPGTPEGSAWRSTLDARRWHRAACVGAAAALLLVSAFLLLWKLGATSLRNGDEARYTQSAREMLLSGDFLNVQYRGEPHLHKPPGKMWTIALGMALLGENEWGARISSALLALGVILLTVLLGRSLFDTPTGLLAGAILTSSVQFVHEHCGRTAECEPEVTFLCVLGMLLTWRLRNDRRWLLGIALGGALLVLVKGPMAIPLLGVVVLFIAVARLPMSAPRWVVPVSILVFLGLALPWHVHQLLTHGEAFKQTYWDAQFWGRFTGNPPAELASGVAGLTPRRGPSYYPMVVFHSMYPWSLLVLPALGWLLIGCRLRRQSPQWLLGLWITLFGLAITLAAGKLHWYAVPLLPCLALSVAGFCRALYRSGRGRGRVVLVLSLLVLSCLFVPTPDYDPYARRSFQWPHHDANIAPLWELEAQPLLSLVPLLTTGLLALIAGAMAARLGRSAGWSCIWALLVGSFLVSGLYHVSLPLRGVERRSEAARCADALDAAGVSPRQVVLLGSVAARLATDKRDYFYLRSMARDADGDLVIHGTVGSGLSEPVLSLGGTLVLHPTRQGDRMLESLGHEQLWRGEHLSAHYLKEDPGS